MLIDHPLRMEEGRLGFVLKDERLGKSSGHHAAAAAPIAASAAAQAQAPARAHGWRAL